MTANTTPTRIRRMRTPGWRRRDAIIVDRSSRYGNPFRVVRHAEGTYGVISPELAEWTTHVADSEARGHAAEQYDRWLNGVGPDVYRVGDRTYDRQRVLADLELGALTGRDLACTCPLPEEGQPDHCHGQTLLRRANPGAGS